MPKGELIVIESRRSPVSWLKPLPKALAAQAIGDFLNKTVIYEGTGASFALSRHVASLLGWGVPAGSHDIPLVTPCLPGILIDSLRALFRHVEVNEGLACLEELGSVLPHLEHLDADDYRDLLRLYRASVVQIGTDLVAEVGLRQPWWSEFDYVVEQVMNGLVTPRSASVSREGLLKAEFCEKLDEFARSAILDERRSNAAWAAKSVLNQDLARAIKFIVKAGGGGRDEMRDYNNISATACAILLEESEYFLIHQAAAASIRALTRLALSISRRKKPLG